jgi:plastocyanin
MLGSLQGELVVVRPSAVHSVSAIVRMAATVALAMVSVTFAGCGKQDTFPVAANLASPSASPSVPTVPQATIDPSTSGSITGSVTLVGTPPTPRLIYMVSEPMCEKMHPTPVASPEIVVGKDGALANVAVYVKSGLANYSFPTPTTPVALTQKGCMYDPHVLALMVGQTLEVTNEDQTLHNVHAMPKINPSWNRGQAGGQPPIDQIFTHEELAIPIQCNIHPWMRSYVFVFKSPYFEITTKSGKFELKNLPPGTYTIEAWQEKYGTADQTVTLGPKESKAISFTFNSSSAGKY